MCDLIRITVTLIHPEDDDERKAADAIGVAGVLSIQSGSADIPLEGDIDVDDVIGAIAGALPTIAAAMEREWSREWAVRRELIAKRN